MSDFQLDDLSKRLREPKHHYADEIDRLTAAMDMSEKHRRLWVLAEQLAKELRAKYMWQVSDTCTRSEKAEARLAVVEKALTRLRERYLSQAQFADPDYAALYREFVHNIDAALTPEKPNE